MVIGLAESLQSCKHQRLPRLEYLAGRDRLIMRLKVHLRDGSTSPRRHTDVYEIRVPRCQRTVLQEKKGYCSRLNSSTCSGRAGINHRGKKRER